MDNDELTVRCLSVVDCLIHTHLSLPHPLLQKLWTILEEKHTPPDLGNDEQVLVP